MMSFWNLAHLESTTNSTAHLSFDAFLGGWLRMATHARAVASAAGFSDQEMSVYMFDETHDLALLKHAGADSQGGLGCPTSPS